MGTGGGIPTPEGPETPAKIPELWSALVSICTNLFFSVREMTNLLQDERDDYKDQAKAAFRRVRRGSCDCGSLFPFMLIIGAFVLAFHAAIIEMSEATIA